MASPTPPLYPLSPANVLEAQFIGKKLDSLPTPAIVLDRAVMGRNCAAMLCVCAQLGVGFRAHVKSHKTVELSKLQVGDFGVDGKEEEGGGGVGKKKANLIVSTVMEAEQLVGYVKEVQGRKGWEASVSVKVFVCLFIYSEFVLGTCILSLSLSLSL